MIPTGLESTGLNDFHERPASALSDMSINLQVKFDNKNCLFPKLNDKI